MSNITNNPTWGFKFQMNNPNSLVPTYGNWCGSNWSAGQRIKEKILTNDQIKVPPTIVNSRPSPLDSWCKTHDLEDSDAYSKPDQRLRILISDINLVNKASTTTWPRLTLGETVYSSLMNGAFRLKIKLFDFPKAIGEKMTRFAMNSFPSQFTRNQSERAATITPNNTARSVASARTQPIARPFQLPPPWLSRSQPAQLGSGRWGRPANRSNAPQWFSSPNPWRSTPAVTHILALRTNQPAWLPTPTRFHTPVRAPIPTPIATPIRIPIRAPWMPSTPHSFGQPRFNTSAHNLVQALSTFTPASSAQTRWPSFNRWSASQHHSGPAWLTIPR